MRTNGQEKFAIGLRVVSVEGQTYTEEGTINGRVVGSGAGISQADGIIQGGAALISKDGTPLDVQTAGVRVTITSTGELCKVDYTVPPLA